jgi:hypothetical protein
VVAELFRADGQTDMTKVTARLKKDKNLKYKQNTSHIFVYMQHCNIENIVALQQTSLSASLSNLSSYV